MPTETDVNNDLRIYNNVTGPNIPLAIKEKKNKKTILILLYVTYLTKTSLDLFSVLMVQTILKITIANIEDDIFVL